MAKEELAEATKNRVAADELFQKYKGVPVDSVFSLNRQDRLEAGKYGAQLGVRKAGFTIEQAEMKLKVLKDFDKDMRTKTIQSEIERAISVERASEAELLLAQGMLKRSRRPKPEPSESEKHVLAVLKEAFTLDGAIHGKLANSARMEKSTPAFRRKSRI